MVERLSGPQRQIYDFILSGDYALVCEGAVRSGKTTHMASAFLIWAMEYFDRACFAVCGKTIQSAERNILLPMQENHALPYSLSYSATRHCLTAKQGGRENWFYLFGGKDAASDTAIQGMTLAGVLFDEVALMPESFVSQAMARCISCPNAKYWFNCNPEGPSHYFYQRWVLPERPGVRRLHFTLEDNPSLTPEMIARTKQLYQGVFYERYILGRWVQAQGRVYPMFGEACLAEAVPGPVSRWVISMDYGIQNPTAMLLWGLCGEVWYQAAEYYHSGRETGRQMTDEDYYRELEKLAGDRDIECVIVDPSAASFLALLRKRRRFRGKKAVNDVLPGIQRTASALQNGQIRVLRCCNRTREEYDQYVWDEKSGSDKPRKDHDHAMDATRYFVSTMGVGTKKTGYRPLWN